MQDDTQGSDFGGAASDAESSSGAYRVLIQYVTDFGDRLVYEATVSAFSQADARVRAGRLFRKLYPQLRKSGEV